MLTLRITHEIGRIARGEIKATVKKRFKGKPGDVVSLLTVPEGGGHGSALLEPVQIQTVEDIFIGEYVVVKAGHALEYDEQRVLAATLGFKTPDDMRDFYVPKGRSRNFRGKVIRWMISL